MLDVRCNSSITAKRDKHLKFCWICARAKCIVGALFKFFLKKIKKATTQTDLFSADEKTLLEKFLKAFLALAKKGRAQKLLFRFVFLFDVAFYFFDGFQIVYNL